MVSSKLGDGFKEASASMMNVEAGIKNIGSPLKGLKDAFGKNGSALKGIGAAVGGAMQGYQMGSAIGDIGQALGMNKGFGSGSKIGGAIGGITGNPIIAAGASVIGGLIGSMFYTPKYGTAQLTGAGDPNITGNKGAYMNASGGAASSIQAGLADIAEKLGGTVGSYLVSIGQYEGAWRVSTSGQNGEMSWGKKNKKNWSTLHNFDGDQAAAIAFAITDAIKDGAITGLSDFARKALNALGADKAVQLVSSYKAITDELDAMRDPIGAAVRSINGPLDSLIAQMKAVAAGSTELAEVEELRSRKLADVLKSQLSSLNDFIKQLNGEGSGRTALDRFNSGLNEFKGLQDRIKAGDAGVDQSAFVGLGQELDTLAKQLFGTSTSQYQQFRAMLNDTANSFKDNVTNAFATANGANAATDAAIAAQTSAVVSQQVITNDLLKQLLNQSKAANENKPVASSGTNVKAINGKIVNREVLY